VAGKSSEGKRSTIRNRSTTPGTRGAFALLFTLLLPASGLTAFIPLLLFASPSTPPGDTVKVAHAGLSGPENLVYDSVADVFLVSNVNGEPGARDNNGFISRVAPDGKVITLKWIEGGRRGARLDSPKGLAIRGDTLVIADLGAVHYFDRRSGRPLRSIKLPGKIMNDVAFADDGTLYVTDTGPIRDKQPVDTSADLDAVYRISQGGKVETVARGLELHRPDGIVVDPQETLVATFAGDRIERVQNDGSAPATYATLPGGRVDGLRRLGDGDLLATSWDTKSVYRISGGVPHQLISGIESPAGIAVDSRRNRLAISSMEENTITIVPLPRTARQAE
jgi:hypothetical protein